jgi:hypothetical protein
MSFSFLEQLWDQMSSYIFPEPNINDAMETAEFKLSRQISQGLFPTLAYKYIYATIERKTLQRSATIQLSDSNEPLEFYDDNSSASHLYPKVFSRTRILECSEEIKREKDEGKEPNCYISNEKFVTIVIRPDMFKSRLKKIGNSHYVLQPPLDKTKDVFAVIETKFDCELFVIGVWPELGDEIEQKLQKCEFQTRQM